MTQVKGEISMSLDGFVAGPHQTLEQPLGEGGELLHEWVVALASFRERHGMEGGERSPDDDLVAEGLRRNGAVVMGRRMFSGGDGPWTDDPNADGWWGDDPPFRVPVFVVTHHARETIVKDGGTSFTFVTGGVESAVEQARAAAGEKDVLVAGGADVIQQALEAGLLDTLLIHVAPVLLAGGVRLFDRPGGGVMTLEPPKVTASPNVTHLEFAVPKGN
jgi:dihydrofolate reductase